MPCIRRDSYVSSAYTLEGAPSSFRKAYRLWMKAEDDQLDIDQRWLDCFVLSGPELKHALRELLDSTEAKRDCVYKARLAVVTHPHYVSMCRRRRSGYPTTQQVLTHGTHHKA